MDSLPPARALKATDLGWVACLAAELATLKRIRDAHSPHSLASRLFRQAWKRLCDGEAPGTVALSISATALVALRLGGIDCAVLHDAGLSDDKTGKVLQAAFDQVAGDLPADSRTALRLHIVSTQTFARPSAGSIPDFVEALIRQPRAGATCPGKPRLMLEPPESHGDHCLAVAVLGVILCAEYHADAATVFLAGLSHHFHNAKLPDSGFAGEVLLGDHLVPIVRKLFDDALSTLPSELAGITREALAQSVDCSTPEGRAFNAADVIDRIMEVRHFAHVARFTEAQALDEMQLVHAGPLHDFHHQVMCRVGLLAA